MIRLGDKEIEYNPEFRFYITTKMSNPHYAPEIAAKAVIVNFAVKEQGKWGGGRVHTKVAQNWVNVSWICINVSRIWVNVSLIWVNAPTVYKLWYIVVLFCFC